MTQNEVGKPVRFQFGIRRLLILTTVAAVSSAWAAHLNAPVFLQAVLAAYLMLFTGWVIMRAPSIWDKNSVLRERWRQVKQRRIELETAALQAKQAIDEARSAGRSEQISEITAAGASHREMHGHLWSLLLFGLVSFVAHPTYGDTHPDERMGNDFESFADQVFKEFFTETDKERRLLDAVVISIEEERRVGEASLQAFLRNLRQQRIGVSQRGKDAAYLKSLVAEIHPRMRNAKRYRSIRVYVAKTKTTDAKAFPGGAIVCSTGLIDFAQSEAALVGVLAHELSHIDRGHQLRIARSQKLAQKTFAPGNTSFDEFAQTGTLLMKQFARPFRLEEEAEADLDAARWVFEIGYEPLEVAALFRRLHQRDQADQVRMPSFLRSHPYHAARDRAVQELASRLKRAKPDQEPYVGRKNIRERITRRERQYPE